MARGGQWYDVLVRLEMWETQVPTLPYASRGHVTVVTTRLTAPTLPVAENNLKDTTKKPELWTGRAAAANGQKEDAASPFCQF